jgi:hypothetical protein
MDFMGTKQWTSGRLYFTSEVLQVLRFTIESATTVGIYEQLNKHFKISSSGRPGSRSRHLGSQSA